MNPYGAVPRALEGTRQTLREIMADVMATKAMDARIRLASAGMDVEKKKLELDLAHQRGAAEVNLAKVAHDTRMGQAQFDETKRANQAREEYQAGSLAEASRRNQALEEYQAGSLAEASRRNQALEGLQGRKVDIQEQTAETAQQKYEWDTQEKPVAQWAEEIGLPPSWREIFITMHGAETITRTQAERAKEMIEKNPALYHKLSLHAMLDRLEEIKAAIESPELPQGELPKLQQEYENTFKVIKAQDRLIKTIDGGKKITGKDLMEIKKDAREQWDMSMTEEEQAQFGSYAAFEKVCVEQFKEVVRQGQENLKQFEKMPIDAQTSSLEQQIKTKLNQLRASDPSKIDIHEQNVMNRMQKGDLESAVRYLDGWMQISSKAPEAGQKPSSAGTASAAVSAEPVSPSRGKAGPAKDLKDVASGEKNRFEGWTQFTIDSSGTIWGKNPKGQTARIARGEKPEVRYGNKSYPNPKYDEYLRLLKQLGLSKEK